MADSNKPKLIIEDDWKKTAPGQTPAAAASKPAADGPSKLVVDSDWKSQAQAEKEKLAKAEEAKKAAGPSGSGGRGGAKELPPAEFLSLVGTLVTQALLYMGAFPDPQTGRAIISLEYARFHIDLLNVLQDKTKGNLTPDEAAELDQALFELRARYVEMVKVVEQEYKRRAAAGGAGAAKMETPAPSGGLS